MNSIARQMVLALFGLIVLGLLVAILMNMVSIRDSLAAAPDKTNEPGIIDTPKYIEEDALLWKENAVYMEADSEDIDAALQAIDLDLAEGEGIRLYSVLWAIRVQQEGPRHGQMSAVLTTDPDIDLDTLSSSAYWLLINDDVMPQVVDFVHSAVDMASSVGTVHNAYTEFHDFSATPIDIFAPKLMLAIKADTDSKSVAGARIYYKKLKPSQ